MVDVVAPLRSEPLFDLIQQPDGKVLPSTTIRFATFLDDLASTLNGVTVDVSSAEGFFSEIQQVQAFTAEITKALEEIDQLAMLAGNASARITEVQKNVGEVGALFEANNLANAKISELQKQVDELGFLMETNDRSDIAQLTNRIKELEELVE